MAKKKITTPEQAQLRIARQVLRMPDAAIPFSGFKGTRKDAQAIVDRAKKKETQLRINKGKQSIRRNDASISRLDKEIAKRPSGVDALKISRSNLVEQNERARRFINKQRPPNRRKRSSARFGSVLTTNKFGA